jgi:hypothetical protein
MIHVMRITDNTTGGKLALTHFGVPGAGSAPAGTTCVRSALPSRSHEMPDCTTKAVMKPGLY